MNNNEVPAAVRQAHAEAAKAYEAAFAKHYARTLANYLAFGYTQAKAEANAKTLAEFKTQQELDGPTQPRRTSLRK